MTTTLPPEPYVDELMISYDLRNNMLRLSDWTQLLYAPLTDEQKQKWRVFRQQLRDLPAHPQWPSIIHTIKYPFNGID